MASFDNRPYKIKNILLFYLNKGVLNCVFKWDVD